MSATPSTSIANPLVALGNQGQSVWLDYIRRDLLTGGELTRLVNEDGVRGVTSNPAIFEKAIAGSEDYDVALATLLEGDGADAKALYEALAIDDIRMAADILRPVYDRTEGADGFVSMEVSPYLARATAETVDEARRLWQVVDRPNLMIKVPATPEGIPAIERLIGEGINVNVTLMFSLADYEAVAQAYLRGLERCTKPESVASVASFFVSRVDTAVDKALDQRGTPEALALRGTIAVTNAKRVYGRFREIFHGPAFARLRERQARPQRVLWASTGTKNPTYSDVLYVEELIGPETVNTMPPATLDAFRDHGHVAPRLQANLETVERTLAELARVGVNFDAITAQLQVDGVKAFADAFDKLLEALDCKRRALQSPTVAPVEFALGLHDARMRARLDQWEKAHIGRRLWRKDPTIWSPDPVPELSDRLGWLDLPESMEPHLDDLAEFSAEIRHEGFEHVVVLGMGGSSLAPEVYGATFGETSGHPVLSVLDSTHPDAITDAEKRLDPAKSLFIVSSKSGTTLETLSLFHAFWDRTTRAGVSPGRHFIAITDPGSALEGIANVRDFRRVFSGPPTVGGRYSALSVFGLVPAALIGVDVHRLLDRAWTMAEASSFCIREQGNPGLRLGAALGELAVAGADKVTFVTSASLAAFPAWLEQLVAESTGKAGKGIVPVADEPEAPADSYGPDRVFVFVVLDGDDTGRLSDRAHALAGAGHPVIQLRLAETADLGQEIFRWEMAVAAASAVLGVHPFNQPDVQLAKELARRAMIGGEGGDGIAAGETIDVSDDDSLHPAVERWATAQPGDYVALQAYLAPRRDTTARLTRMRSLLGDRLRIATTLGFGPRFLHSTGQLHKGGPGTGLFLQLVDEPPNDVAVPETDYSFGALIRAQALGDYQALLERRRRVLRVNLGTDVVGGLARLEAAVP